MSLSAAMAVRRARQEIARLRKIVEQLPRTADGVYVPQDFPITLWHIDDEYKNVIEDVCYDRAEVAKAFSTEEAAQTAVNGRW